MVSDMGISASTHKNIGTGSASIEEEDSFTSANQSFSYPDESKIL
jgi:hypothetical protein